MKQKIYKYELRIDDIQSLVLPINAEIISLQCQRDIPCIWVKLDINERLKDDRIFETYGTGHPLRHESGTRRKYIGTYQAQFGAFVGHVFEVIKTI